MRRELSLAGASLVVYACALVLASLVICGTGHASELAGEWATQGNAAHVQIEQCSTAPSLLCGLVTCECGQGKLPRMVLRQIARDCSHAGVVLAPRI
jgi:hypothetical protein